MWRALAMLVILCGCGGPEPVPMRSAFQTCLASRNVCGDPAQLSYCLPVGGLEAFQARCGIVYDTSVKPARYRTTGPVDACEGAPDLLPCCEPLSAQMLDACKIAIGE